MWIHGLTLSVHRILLLPPSTVLPLPSSPLCVFVLSFVAASEKGFNYNERKSWMKRLNDETRTTLTVTSLTDPTDKLELALVPLL